jgi:hypothetical protein
MDAGKYAFLLSLFLIPSLFTTAGDMVVPFNESWAIKVSGRYVTASFTQDQSAQYTVKKPWTLGLGVRYKDVSASLFLPSFRVFANRPFESFDIQLSSYYDFMYYEAFCKRYQDFSDKERENENVDLHIFSSGISAGWLLNGKNHSLSAAYDLDCKQLSSNGSVVLGLGIFYTSILSGDENIKRYNDNQHLIYFGPHVGYSYTFIFSKNIFLNMNFTAGLDAGYNVTADKWLFIPLIMPKISFGHHHKTWSINIAAAGNYTAIPWDMNTVDKLLPATLKVTFSKRF